MTDSKDLHKVGETEDGRDMYVESEETNSTSSTPSNVEYFGFVDTIFKLFLLAGIGLTIHNVLFYSAATALGYVLGSVNPTLAEFSPTTGQFLAHEAQHLPIGVGICLFTLWLWHSLGGSMEEEDESLDESQLLDGYGAVQLFSIACVYTIVLAPSQYYVPALTGVLTPVLPTSSTMMNFVVLALTSVLTVGVLRFITWIPRVSVPLDS